MVSSVIKTEGGYLSNFQETTDAIDEAYFLSYDSLSTVNSFIYVLTATLMSIFAFAFVYYNNREASTVSLGKTILFYPIAFGWFPLFHFLCIYFNIMGFGFNKDIQ